MPRRLLMGTIRTRCLQRADMETDLSVSTSETNSLISEQYGDHYSVVAAAGLRYFEKSTSFTTAGLSYLAEPVDHLSTVDTIERVVSATTGRSRRLRQLAPQERTVWTGRTGHARRWELVDDRINLYPTPPSGDVYVLRYIPQPPDLTSYADGDVVDVVTPDGEAFLIWGVTVKLLAKSARDTSLAEREREQARGRLSEWASLRAFNDSPRTIVDDDDDGDLYRDGSYWYDR